VTGRLLSLLRLLVRPQERDWFDALVAEREYTDKGRLVWLTGAVSITGLSLARRAAGQLPLWLMLLASGLLIGYVDLEIERRWPFFALTLGSVAAVSFWKAELPWAFVATVLFAFCLPALIMLGFEGPYSHDSGRTTFPVLPAVSVALGAFWLRRRWNARRQPTL
jgi:hypothetical protein